VPRDAPVPPRGEARERVTDARIGDYALIGDCRTAALVSRAGELAWLCLPHFSSPSVFGSLLDTEAGGRWLIAPVGLNSSSRSYREGTNVLETTFSTQNGAVTLTDSMPVPCESRDLRPMREVLRRIRGVSGEVRLQVVIDPRPEYGCQAARLERRRADLWAWTWGSNILLLQTTLALTSQGTVISGEVVVRGGECFWCSLSYAQSDIAVIPGLDAAAQQRLDATARWWEAWSSRARYDGPHRAAIVRSALTLKLMNSAQSAAIVAAPTTSLPEWPGADRNWDYRYCWLRDAALTMRAFTGLGYLEEGRAFLDWLLHATRLTWPQLRVLYDIYGRCDEGERELTHWRGFRDSRPVRVGNAARAQLQLDVYGAVCFAARDLVEATGELKGDEARLLRGLGDEVCKHWQEPDHSIWEIRGRPRQYTFSKIMCWSALDSLLRLEAAGHLKVKPHVDDAAGHVRAEIEARGFNEDTGSYVDVLDGDGADAGLLLAGCLGYRDPAHERMRGTFAYVHRKLARNGLLYRYEGQDEMRAPEGAFAICSFFAIDHLAGRKELAEAHASLRHVLSFANDVGLLAEEIDPDSGELLGNFPQAYTHVGLINAALGIARAEAGRNA
jgi:GH15 family glucan-1,4-alpha-glucosidase